MYTFKLAPSTAARANAAATPASLRAMRLPLYARNSAWSTTAAAVRMMSSGTSHAPTNAAWMAASFAACCSGVSFGIR